MRALCVCGFKGKPTGKAHHFRGPLQRHICRRSIPKPQENLPKTRSEAQGRSGRNNSRHGSNPRLKIEYVFRVRHVDGLPKYQAPCERTALFDKPASDQPWQNISNSEGAPVHTDKQQEVQINILPSVLRTDEILHHLRTLE